MIPNRLVNKMSSDLVNDIPNETTGKFSRAAANPLRTAAQLVPATVIVEFVDAFGADFTGRQYAAAVGALLLVTSLVQNLYEQAKGKAFLK